MDGVALTDLSRRKKAQSLRLMEVSDLTKQMAQALDRRDEVSMRVLLAMRQEPALQLQELENGIEAYLLSLPEAEAVRCKELLNGAAAEQPEEAMLCEQVTQFRRLLASVIELDKRVSLRMGGNKSFYKKFR